MAVILQYIQGAKEKAFITQGYHYQHMGPKFRYVQNPALGSHWHYDSVRTQKLCTLVITFRS